MVQLLRTLVNICLLRAGPQALPAHYPLLWTLVAAYWASGLALLDAADPDANNLYAMTISAVFALGFSYALLALRQFAGRFAQTATALFGTDLVLLLPSAPLLLQAAASGEALPHLGLLVVWMWSIAIKGHIFRHALEVPLFVGIGIALGYTALGLLLTADL